MRWILLLALFATAVAAEYGFAQEKDNPRTLWVYEGGWFAKSKDGTWYELNETTFRTLGKPAKFDEAKRTKDYVDLHDGVSRVYIRLYDNRAELLTRKGDWEKRQTGRWKKPE